MTNKPTVVPLGNRDDVKANLETLRRSLHDIIEHAGLVAQFRRAYFQALVREGFTEAQALELCKHSCTF